MLLDLEIWKEIGVGHSLDIRTLGRIDEKSSSVTRFIHESHMYRGAFSDTSCEVLSIVMFA